MKYTLEELTELIKNQPTKEPIYNVHVDYSGDLSFREVPQERNIDQEDMNIVVIDSLRQKRVINEDGTYEYVINVDSTLHDVIDTLKDRISITLRRALPHKYPERTNLYKWFRKFNAEPKDYKLILSIYNYIQDNADACRASNSVHAQNLVGLITHIGRKNGGL